MKDPNEKLITHFTKNEMDRRFMSLLGMNAQDMYNSASRKAMTASQLGQALTIQGATENTHTTGMDRAYGKYTFSVRMPETGSILKIYPKYPESTGDDRIKLNPETLVIYESAATRRIGSFVLPRYCSKHSYFGFKYKPGPALSKLKVGANIKKDEIFLDSPSVTRNGGYKNGISLRTAYFGMPGIAEDGIIFADDIVDEMCYSTFEHRSGSFGSDVMPLNLNGTIDEYKIIPDIGDPVRPDGILFGFRSFRKDLALVEQSIYDLMELQPPFDTYVYVPGPGGIVVDVKVFHDPKSAPETTPIGMADQLVKYDRATKQYYQEIMRDYKRMVKEKSSIGETLLLTDAHKQLVETACAYTGDAVPWPVVKMYRKRKMDDWRIEVVVEYKNYPFIGSKGAGMHGNKGVFVLSKPRHEMPVDDDGNSADIIIDPRSPIARQNPGCLIELYYNAAARDTLKTIREMIGLPRNGIETLTVKELQRIDDEDSSRPVLAAFDYLKGFLKIVVPHTQYKFIEDGTDPRTPYEHIADLLEDCIQYKRSEMFLYNKPEQQPNAIEVGLAIKEHYRPVHTPVTFVDELGIKRRSKERVRIASCYFLLLEKTGDTWTAVDTAKTQLFGVPAQTTKVDKYTTPGRKNPIRGIGESELRILISFTSIFIAAHIIDRYNNPEARRSIVRALHQTDQPTNIEETIDRNQIKIGGAMPLKLLNHYGLVQGWKFSFKPYHMEPPPSKYKVVPYTTNLY